MDDLTPMEPEYREIPPEPAVSDPYYYGTGSRPPQQQRSHAAAILTVVALVFAANLFTVGMLLWMRSGAIPSVSDSSKDTSSLPVGTEEALNVTQTTEDSSGTLEIQSAGSTLTRTEIYQKVAPGLVQIAVGEASFTGVVLTQDGYILVNAAALGEDDQPEVTLSDGSTYTARRAGSDGSSDLALLKIEVSGLTTAQLGKAERLQAGDTVYAFSFPFGSRMQVTMTEGFISSVGTVDLSGTQMQILQTDVALQNAGGPIVNACGQIVAFQVGRVGDYVSYDTVAEIGFALPINEVDPIINQLMRYGYVSGRASLGVEVAELSEAQRIYWDLPQGVIISEIRTDSNAFAAGLRAGDVLISIGGVKVTDESSYYSALNSVQAGERVRVVIYRGGAQMYADIVLNEATE